MGARVAGARCTAGARGAGGAALERPPLVFTGAAPYAGILAALERPSQTRISHRALPADMLGFFDLQQGRARVADRKEQLRIHVTAGGVGAPVHSVYSSMRPFRAANGSVGSSFVLVNHFTKQGTCIAALASRRRPVRRAKAPP